MLERYRSEYREAAESTVDFAFTTETGPRRDMSCGGIRSFRTAWCLETQDGPAFAASRAHGRRGTRFVAGGPGIGQGLRKSQPPFDVTDTLRQLAQQLAHSSHRARQSLRRLNRSTGAGTRLSGDALRRCSFAGF